MDRHRTPADYRQMSADLKAKMQRLEAKLDAINDNNINIVDLLDRGISTLLKLDVIYDMGDIEKKREVISSVFPEKLSFSKFGDRTGRINGAVRIIYSLDAGSGGNKKGQSGSDSTLSCQVGVAGQLSNRFLSDLEKIGQFLSNFDDFNTGLQNHDRKIS